MVQREQSMFLNPHLSLLSSLRSSPAAQVSFRFCTRSMTQTVEKVGPRVRTAA
jgi:hypothetical protein